jgi:hypothetical protein
MPRKILKIEKSIKFLRMRIPKKSPKSEISREISKIKNLNISQIGRSQYKFSKLKIPKKRRKKNPGKDYSKKFPKSKISRKKIPKSKASENSQN